MNLDTLKSKTGPIDKRSVFTGRFLNPRHLKGFFFIALSYLCAITVVLALVLILGTITIKALPHLNLDFILTSEAAQSGYGGAIGNAVVGTIILSVCSTLLATPIAVCTAIYLKRYASDNLAVRSFRFLIDVLSGTPSIVVGVFGLLLLVFYMREYTGSFSL
ncbi:MAG: hypothetical protein SCH66_11875, partial [Methanolobus sp.]|nr:hypothetical protein [Methanolobus sp.]